MNLAAARFDDPVVQEGVAIKPGGKIDDDC